MTARPQPIDPVPEEFKPMIAMAEAAMGYVPNNLLIMLNKPALAQAVTPMLAYLNSPAMKISPELRQMVAYMSSFGAGCSYCQAHTSHGAERAGVSTEKIGALWEFETSDLFDDAERAALSFAFASGQIPNAVEESHYEALSQHYDQDEIIDICSIIAIFGFLNRWSETLGTRLESEPGDFAKDVLSASGWTMG